MSYNSKYSGQQVENLLDQVAKGGGITEETDPIFSASPAAKITDGDIEEWNSKQDKFVSGTTIKTINGESILGEGNIVIEGGGVTEEYVNNAISSAITTTLNTAV